MFNGTWYYQQGLSFRALLLQKSRLEFDMSLQKFVIFNINIESSLWRKFINLLRLKQFLFGQSTCHAFVTKSYSLFIFFSFVLMPLWIIIKEMCHDCACVCVCVFSRERERQTARGQNGGEKNNCPSAHKHIIILDTRIKRRTAEIRLERNFPLSHIVCVFVNWQLCHHEVTMTLNST